MSDPELFSSRVRRARAGRTLWLIYRITDGEKNYIGATCRSLHERWLAHLHRARWGFDPLPGTLHAAIREKGASAFRMTIIAEALTESEARDKEQRYIVEFDALMPRGFQQFPARYQRTLIPS